MVVVVVLLLRQASKPAGGERSREGLRKPGGVWGELPVAPEEVAAGARRRGGGSRNGSCSGSRAEMRFEDRGWGKVEWAGVERGASVEGSERGTQHEGRRGSRNGAFEVVPAMGVGEGRVAGWQGGRARWWWCLVKG